MSEKNLRDQAILKLNQILRQGHLPCRSFKPYGLSATYIANCFIHAVYNLSDKQLKSLNSLEMDEIQKHIYRSNQYDREAINESIFSVIKESGLKFQRVGKNHPCKKNQWIIAYYLSAKKYSLNIGVRREYEDYHFMLKEKNGYWSEKMGPLADVRKYDQPPLTIDHYSHIYQLQGYYLITNPYADKKNKKEDNNGEGYGK